MSFYDISLIDRIKRDLAQQWAGSLKNNYDEISRIQHTSVYDPPPMELYEDAQASSADFVQGSVYEEQAQQEEYDTMDQNGARQYYAGTSETEPNSFEDHLYRQQPSVFIEGSGVYFDGEYFGSLEDCIEEGSQNPEVVESLLQYAESAQYLSPEDQMAMLLLLECMGG